MKKSNTKTTTKKGKVDVKIEKGLPDRFTSDVRGIKFVDSNKKKKGK